MTNSDSGPLTHPLASQRSLPLLLILFVGSGCAALIYEVVWLQLLQLVIGSTGISLGVLLGIFMGGMCLGSLLLPRLVPPHYHPLRVYAVLEFGIGLLGVAILFGLPLLSEMYERFMGHGVQHRALVAAVCLLPPTVLMGATLPAIARWVKSTPEGVSWMGFFYAGNIAGAVLGCLLAGFYLLRVHDMPTATYAAVAVNAAVALVALAVASRAAYGTKPEKKVRRKTAEAAAGKTGIYFIIGLSGLCALGAEVLWTRLLSLMLGATVYTFSIILAMFLAGLGIGSSIGAYWARTVKNARAALGVCQLLVAVMTAWAAFMITRSIPFWPIDLYEITREWGPWYIFLLDLLRAGCAVLPAAVLWGASFPLALAAVAVRGQDTGRMMGSVYAANTVGAIVGSLAFSMLVIPQLGTQWGQRLVILLAALSALVAFGPLFAPRRKAGKKQGKVHRPPAFSKGKSTGAFAGLAVVVLLVVLVAPVPWSVVAFGRHAYSYMPFCNPGIVEDQDVPYDPEDSDDYYCVYVGEGMNVSVAVSKHTSGWRYFHGAGKVQASSHPNDMRLQRMLGHLSVLARTDPDEARDVLVVACGAGVTAGSFVPYPNVERITICDIEPLVPRRVTPRFGEQNYHVVDGIDQENPHTVNGKEVTVAYDDGRHYIRTLPKEKKFDIITSDPIDPWVKGCAALNTVEYYEMCKAHLNPGGVMSLWMPLYESDEETVKSLISTFFKVFPNGIVFSNDVDGKGFDAILLGQVEPTQIDLDRLQARLAAPEYTDVCKSLLEVGYGQDIRGLDWKPNLWRDPALSLLSTYAGRAADMAGWMENAQINTDRNLRLQYLAGMSLNSFVQADILSGILKYYRFPEDLFTGSPERVREMKLALQTADREEKR